MRIAIYLIIPYSITHKFFESWQGSFQLVLSIAATAVNVATLIYTNLIVSLIHYYILLHIIICGYRTPNVKILKPNQIFIAGWYYYST